MQTSLIENVKLEDKPLKVGDIAPDFCLSKIENRIVYDVRLSDFKNNTYKLISTFPSIDTGVCDLQTKKFNQMYGNRDDITLINVSTDLPFAFKKWCELSNNPNMIMLSDYKDHSFAKAYGINVVGANLIYRSFFILDKDNKILYIQHAKAIPEHLNYEEIEQFLKNLLK